VGAFVLRGGRVIDPQSSTDGAADVLVRERRVVEVGTGLVAPGAEEIDVSGCLVLPGLIDFHVHTYVGGTSCGLPPDELAADSALTTLVDAGSAGAGNIDGFIDNVVAASSTRNLCFVNIAFPGIYALSEHVLVGEAEDVRLLHVGACVQAARAHHEHVIGIKVRLGSVASGRAGIAPLFPALEAASAVGLPVMVHIDTPPPDVGAVLDRLRPGDVLTHCGRADPNSLLERGRVIAAARLARERGVLFDVGHGLNSFDFESCRRLLDQEFQPDILSSDAHRLSVGGLQVGLLHVMSRVLALGMPLAEIVRAVTVNPAAVCGVAGSVTAATDADLSIVRLEHGDREFRDGSGNVLRCQRFFAPVGRVRAGRWEPLRAEGASS
jgi:dihydroorotase